MHQAERALWEERILALEASGLSRRAWSKEQGIMEQRTGNTRKPSHFGYASLDQGVRRRKANAG